MKNVKDKSVKFAKRIIKLYKYLTTEKKEFVLAKQILRSGTGIGANIVEAQCGCSKEDFLEKCTSLSKSVLKQTIGLNFYDQVNI